MAFSPLLLVHGLGVGAFLEQDPDNRLSALQRRQVERGVVIGVARRDLGPIL
jgi:hypothetical protein